MDELTNRFDQAVEELKTFSSRPHEEALLELYALYKQIKEGDVSGSSPSFFDFVARAKFQAREHVKGMSTEQAMQRYIDLVESLKPQYS